MRSTKTIAAVLTALGLASATIAGTFAASSADAAGTAPVGQKAATYTPWLSQSVPGQDVQQLVQCGDTMYAVGLISAVNQGTSSYTRGNAFSFSATTGTVSSWAPQFNGRVDSVVLSPDCGTAYLGGEFTTVNGSTVKNIAAVSTSTGALVPGFQSTVNGPVQTLQYTQGVIVAGGAFTKVNAANRSRLASLDPITGAATSLVNLPVTGGYALSPTPKIYNSQLNHAGTKMLVEGVFTSVGGQPRQQVAMIDLSGTTAVTDAWYPTEFNGVCSANKNFYAKDAAWSPDDATVYVAATGYKPPTGPGSSTSLPRAGLCDAAIAFPATSTPVTHTWINYTGCDSLFAVAADDGNVYVGGHQRYLDNPLHCDGPGTGSVPRQGIGGIDPLTGMATTWNPTKSRGHGVEDLLLTSAGLWIASDNGGPKPGLSQTCAHLGNHGGICFLPR